MAEVMETLLTDWWPFYAVIVLLAYYLGKKLNSKWWVVTVPFIIFIFYFVVLILKEVNECSKPNSGSFCGMGIMIGLFYIGVLLASAAVLGFVAYGGFKNNQTKNYIKIKPFWKRWFS